MNGLAYSALEYLEALRWRGPALAAHLEAIGKLRCYPDARRAHRRADHRRHRRRRRAPLPSKVILGITRFMRPVNYLGLPSLVVPAGQPAARHADRAAADRAAVPRRAGHRAGCRHSDGHGPSPAHAAPSVISRRPGPWIAWGAAPPGHSHPRIIRAAGTFRRHPCDVLRRVLDVAGLAVHAVLRVDLKARLAAILVATIHRPRRGSSAAPARHRWAISAIGIDGSASARCGGWSSS